MSVLKRYGGKTGTTPGTPGTFRDHGRKYDSSDL